MPYWGCVQPKPTVSSPSLHCKVVGIEKRKTKQKPLRWKWNIFIYYVFVWVISLSSFVYYISMLSKRVWLASLSASCSQRILPLDFDRTVFWLHTRLRSTPSPNGPHVCICMLSDKSRWRLPVTSPTSRKKMCLWELLPTKWQQRNMAHLFFKELRKPTSSWLCPLLSLES